MTSLEGPGGPVVGIRLQSGGPGIEPCFLCGAVVVVSVVVVGDGGVVACLAPQQHASVSQGSICSDSFTCCHTDIPISPSQSILTPKRPVPALTL